MSIIVQNIEKSDFLQTHSNWEKSESWESLVDNGKRISEYALITKTTATIISISIAKTLVLTSE